MIRERKILVALFAACIFWSGILSAATISWTNTSGGNWSTNSNWSPNQVPSASDTVLITNNGTYTVTLDVSATIDSLTLGGASGKQTLTNSGSTLLLNSAVSVQTNGILGVSGGSVQSISLTVNGLLNWTGGVLFGALALAGNSVANWTGGTLGGGGTSLTVATNGVLNITGSGMKSLSPNTALTNAGHIYWSGTGDIQYSLCCYASTINNLPGGVFEAQSDQTLNFPWGNSFLNAGRFLKSGGSGTTTIYMPLVNTGTIEAQSGTIAFNGMYSSSASLHLTVLLGGPAPGAGQNRIQFSTPIELTGAFTVSTRNGFRPNPGDTFDVLSYPSATSEFTCLKGLDLGGGVLLLPQFTETSLSLMAAAYATNSAQPRLFVTRSPTGVRVTWPIGFPGWGLQSTTNLTSSNWSSLSAQCDNQALLPVTVPRQFFRLKQ